MADKTFKINDTIELGYQAPNKQSGVTVIAEIYLPNKAKDSNFPDVTLTEIGTTGTYRGSFTPDAQGVWQVITHLSPSGDGQVVKNYSVGGYNVDSVGAGVTIVDNKVDVVDDKVDAVGTGVATVDGKVTAVDGKVTTVDGKVDTANTKLDEINNKVSALDTPPMAF